jgi:hypothetical protein
MNSPLNTYFADLANRTAQDISLVNDNARLQHMPRRESPMTSPPRLSRWDNMGSNDSIKEMTPIARIPSSKANLKDELPLTMQCRQGSIAPPYLIPFDLFILSASSSEEFFQKEQIERNPIEVVT